MKRVITLLLLALHMANQYSITISNEADAVLKRCKEHRLKVSQAISTAIETLGFDALARLCANQRSLEFYRKETNGDDDE